MENQMAGYIIIVLVASIFWVIKSWSKEIQEKEAQKKDVNVTFKNGISLEKKQYPEMKDDFRENSYKLEPKGK